MVGRKLTQRPRHFITFCRDQKISAVYVLEAVGYPYCKIGIADDPLRRLSGVQAGNWSELKLVDHWWTLGRELSFRVEQAVLKALIEHKVRGEWLEISKDRLIEEIQHHAAGMNIGLMDEEDIIPVAMDWQNHKDEKELGMLKQRFAKEARFGISLT
jgi:hypothetical protein